MNDYGVLLVYTTSAAVRGEKMAKQAGVPVKLIPVPRQFSSDCGLALRFEWAQRDALEAAMVAAGIEVAGIHRL